ncbi:MAG: peptidoglycan DD-metalloendopeptidase family protein [bacterium]|nr:peptidoglycan DD-metalloendopeptidase family protein [bacterium]
MKRLNYSKARTYLRTRIKQPVFLLVLSLLIVASISAFNLPFVQAQSQQIEDLKRQINNVQQDSHAKEEAQGVLGIEASSLNDAINKLQGQIDASRNRINQLQGEVTRLNKQISSSKIELAKQKKLLGENIKLMYLEGDISTLEMLATSNDLSDFFDKQQYRKSVQSKIITTFDKVTTLKLELDTKRKTVQATLEEQRELRNQLAAQKAEKGRVLGLNQDQQNQLENQIKANSGKLAELKNKRAEMEAALARSLSSRSYRTAPAGQVSAGDVVGAVGNTGFSTGAHLHLEVRNSNGTINPAPYIKSKPVSMPPAWISQGYGAANSWYRSGYHMGIDYASNSGAPIFAIDGGQMYRGCSNQLLGTSNNGYGYVAIVEHSNGTKSVYAHMSGGPAACSYNSF